jgi:hypothetical protein
MSHQQKPPPLVAQHSARLTRWAGLGWAGLPLQMQTLREKRALALVPKANGGGLGDS